MFSGGTFYNSSGMMIGISVKEIEEKNFNLLSQILFEIYGEQIPEEIIKSLKPENQKALKMAK